MTAKQRVVLAIAAVFLLAVIVFFIWYLQRPEHTPEGTLVYREAYMRIAEQPWQGERLCHSR